MKPRLSSETLHATTVAKGGRAVLISGRSGSGKSDLALRLLDRGFVLVSDDQTYLRITGGTLVAAAPPTIRGKLEVRGIGIVAVEAVDDVPVCLVVELAGDIDRMPDEGRERLILGAKIPLVSIDALSASAPAKVAMALDRLGLKV
ncbi:MAG: HPr kinase/phosphatase C-terminal domain-containing protein [Sphingomicrobium sp.]